MSKVISFLLVFVLLTISCNADYGLNYENFYDYGINGHQLDRPQLSFGNYGASLGSNYVPSFDPNYDSEYGSNYNPNYGSNLAASYRSNYDSNYGPNVKSNYEKYLEKNSNENKRRRYGKIKSSKPCDLTGYQLNDYYLTQYQSKEYSKPVSKNTYSDSHTYSSTNGEQLNSLLSMVLLLGKQLSTNQPVIQNFVNPSLGSSNPSSSYYKLPQNMYHRMGGSSQSKSRNEILK